MPKPDKCSSSLTMEKIRKEISKLILFDYDQYDMMKCLLNVNVNFEEIDTELSIGKSDGF